MEENIKIQSATQADATPIEPIPRTSVSHLRDQLGHDAILLPCDLREKHPNRIGWQNTSPEVMKSATYLQQLERGNVAILHTKGRCAIDIDNDLCWEKFLEINPRLKNTFCVKGKRGGKIFIKVKDWYPKTTVALQFDSNHAYSTEFIADGPNHWGEFRSDGSCSVVAGTHPEGMQYTIVNDMPVQTISFGEIIWPDYVEQSFADMEFDDLAKEYGRPYRGKVPSEIFFAGKFVAEHPVKWDAERKHFYHYEATSGIWEKLSTEFISGKLRQDYQAAVHEFGNVDLDGRNTNYWQRSVVGLIKDESAIKEFPEPARKWVHTDKGMLRLQGAALELHSFSPDYHSTRQIPVSFDPEAQCPRFMEFLRQSLNEDDITLFQRWFGSAVLATNPAHAILIVTGTAGGGKSTLMNIVEQTIGEEVTTELRTSLLGERFELARFQGMIVIKGMDVASNFLDARGASSLKSLVGGDKRGVERKGQEKVFRLKGERNVIITANAQIKPRLDGDADAWRRRLWVIEFTFAKPERPIANLAEDLIADEGPGILNFALRGAVTYSEQVKNGGITLSAAQIKRIDDLLADADSVRSFITRHVVAADGADVGATELWEAYRTFCNEMDFTPVNRKLFGRNAADLIEQIHGARQSHDLTRGLSMNLRGYKNLTLTTNNNR